MAGEIKSITSEALEAAYRALTPSQSGFTQDLQASNTIIPVLDLTASAEGTTTPISMQQALAFGSQTAFNVNNGSTNIITNPGFYRIVAGIMVKGASAAAQGGGIDMTDGLSTKRVWGLNENAGGTADPSYSFNLDVIVFNASGITTSIQASANAYFVGSVRQIANSNGELVNPSGFTPQ